MNRTYNLLSCSPYPTTNSETMNPKFLQHFWPIAMIKFYKSGYKSRENSAFVVVGFDEWNEFLGKVVLGCVSWLLCCYTITAQESAQSIA